METTIRVTIANGYRPALESFIETHPGLSREEAVRLWAEERYGGWIARELATDQFDITLVPGGEQFEVAFRFEDHATRFVAEVGGQIVRGNDGEAV